MKVSLDGMMTEVRRILSQPIVGAEVYASALEKLQRDIKKLMRGSVSVEEFAKHYCIELPATGGVPAVPDAVDQAFEAFKEIYAPLGFRNNWGPARVKFLQLVKRDKVDPAVILAGARAYAATTPDKQFVPRPSGWLHQKQYAWDWASGGPRKSQGPDMYDMESFLERQARDRQ